MDTVAQSNANRESSAFGLFGRENDEFAFGRGFVRRGFFRRIGYVKARATSH
jgi:hypothetical protein